MPKAAILSSWVETAQKWSATAASPSAAETAARAVCALVIVSSVVNVLEQTMNRVVASGTASSVSPRLAPSTLATKCRVRWSATKGASARAAMAGPRSEPPMPMLTTSVKRWPLAALMAPPRTASAKAPIFSRSAATSGITSWPCASIALPGVRVRSAMCITARPSVTLIASPPNNAARRSSSLAARTSANSRSIVSDVTRCLE